MQDLWNAVYTVELGGCGAAQKIPCNEPWGYGSHKSAHSTLPEERNMEWRGRELYRSGRAQRRAFAAQSGERPAEYCEYRAGGGELRGVGDDGGLDRAGWSEKIAGDSFGLDVGGEESSRESEV